MKYKYLVLSSAIFGVLSLTGCGGGSGTTTTDTGVDDAPITTAFSVNVQIPDGLSATEVLASAPASFFDDFFISTAAAATVSDQLGAGNFKVAIVDAAGVVQDIVIPESISQEPDGSWIVVLAGGTRVDCVIIADISKTPEVTVGQTLPADAIYAPTASEQFDIDIRSTAAFQEFIEAVEDSLDLTAGSGFTEEQVAALVEAAQTLPLPAYTVGQTLEEYLVTAILELESEIEREVIVVNNSDTTFNLANYFEGGGVLNWIYGEGGQFYERGQFSYDSTAQTISDLEQEYNADTKTWVGNVANPYTDALILTATGWVANQDLDELDSFNADGSFTLKDKGVAEDKEDISAVKVDVSGQQINLFATGFKAVLANTAVFSAGAEAFLISSSTTLDTYKIWANEFNGTVNVWEKFNNTGAVITTLDEIFSATASTETDPSLINTVSIYASNAEYRLEFVGTGTTGTVNVRSIDYGASPPVSSVIETTTWERKTVNGKDMVLVDAANSSIAEEGLVFYMLTVYNNQLAEGEFIPAGTVSEDGSEYLFNDIAAADINNNFDPDRLACGFSSGWDDTADGGLGAPIVPNSFADFEAVVIDCGAFNIATSDVAGNSFSEGGAITTYDAMATVATEVAPGTGNFFDDSANENIDFKWYLEAATCSGCTHDYLVVYSDSTIDVDLPVGFELRETAALTGISGDLLSFTHYTEQNNYGDMVRSIGTDGEIWNDTVVLQP